MSSSSTSSPVDSPIHSFVFAAWDNVVGPKILKTWPVSVFSIDEVGVEISEGLRADLDTSDFCATTITSSTSTRVDVDDIAKYISTHTLTGHLAKAKHTDFDSVNEVCLVVPALGFVSQTATFYCLFLPNCDGDVGSFCTEEPCMSSLTIVFHHSHLKMFWNLQPLVLHLLKKITERLKVGLSQDLMYHEEPLVSKWLGEIYSTLMDTHQLCLRPHLTTPIPVKKLLNSAQIAWDVVITAMLTTLGSCCVVGSNKDHINRVIDVLAFFLPESQQLNCSRYAANEFSGGLYLQGLLENANGVRLISASDVLLNEFPLTLVDLSRKGKIKYTGHVHEHHRNRQRHSREQEFNIIQRREPDIPFTTESVFRNFTESSRYVRWCLEQLTTHNSEHWTRIVTAFHQALALQAHDVIKAFEPVNLTNGEKLKTVRNQLKQSLKITEVDFWLLAATAERLKPGFCQIFGVHRV